MLTWKKERRKNVIYANMEKVRKKIFYQWLFQYKSILMKYTQVTLRKLPVQMGGWDVNRAIRIDVAEVVLRVEKHLIIQYIPIMTGHTAKKS